ncbi:AsmA family protein [Reichenbachiella carrageenanivorans]|uniref:AsmA family protein n=1 Tax=Reichenbachiella carrageenanivorans TaxID=2979869 RepID=A0ABY6D2K0_9BACT|nr:AsmA-like C-terminal region-containing protein [Reichenbachiella carrageenanivorans]UXX80376.1 AsmA family protein [Reichenbachiella carrageenanivorans]
MKKTAKIFGITLAILMAVTIFLPLIFKDEIKEAVDEAIAENVNAKVYYDQRGFRLSLIPNFPNFTFSMSDFGVAGIEPFEGDTLLQVGTFEFVIDLLSVVSGDQIAINAILLDEPNINIKVLKDGRANYDILKTSEAPLDVEEDSVGEATTFNISIKQWDVVNGNLVYDDQSMQVLTKIGGLYHSGKGDFTEDVFDLFTITKVKQLSADYEGVSYLSNKKLEMEMTLNMDLPQAKYTFKHNYIKLNNFRIGIDGYVSMPSEDIDMDITYTGQDISIASILSLIPGVYQEYIDGISVAGDINFNGTVKGTYNEKVLPTVTANLDIVDGSIKYDEYPIPMKKINMKSSLLVPGENMDAMTFDMPQFSLQVDGEPLVANLHFENLKNYTWDFGFDGNVDFEKVLKIVPVEGINLKGKLNAKLKTSGNMRLVDQQRYNEIPAKGSMTLTGFYFDSPDLPQGFGIKETKLKFTPKEIALTKFDATIGKSDMQMNGSLSNFIGYALSETQTLKGQLNFYSNQFDLNEWMSEADTAEVAESTETTTLEVVRLPININFALNSKIKKILYDNMVIEDLDGLITVKNGTARLDSVGFRLLDGDFEMNGGYNSVPNHPLYDFEFSVQHLSISTAFASFNTIEKMAPVAKNMQGQFSTEMKIAGTLDEGMEPNLNDMNGSGVLLIEEAFLQGEKLMDAIAKVAKFDDDTLKIKDTQVTFEIKDGRMFVDPYTINYAGYEATVFGSNGFDGSIDYNVSSEIPTGAVGAAVNSLLAQYTGGQALIGETIPLSINVAGTYDNPKVGLGQSTSTGSEPSAKDAATAAAKEAFEKQKKIAEDKAKAELEAQKKIAEQKAKAEEERLKKEAEEKAKQSLNSLFKK